ncbi:MAG: DNA polymerase III subunit delta [Thermoanaerobacteraceae bacterium]|nr:DNA polymerase III subunit delta [Thermoanaerobacteraceae bacterium]
MDFKEFLKVEANQLNTVYIFNGSNGFIKEYAIDYLTKKYIKTTKAINLQKIVPGLENFEGYFFTPPMMGEKKFIVVEEEVLEAKEKVITGLLEKIPETNCVIIKVNDIKKHGILNNKFKKADNIVQFDMLKGNELKSWISGCFGSCGKKADSATVNYLSTISDDLYYLYNEIQKIISFAYDENNIKLANIREILPVKIEDRVFDMVDAIGSGDKSRALKLYRDMVLLGYNYFYIMGMIIRQYRLLFQIKALIDEGATSEVIKSKTGLADFAVKKLYEQARQYELKNLKFKLERCLKMDVDVKTGKVDEKIAVEKFIAEA